LHHLKESGEIEAAADKVLLIHRDVEGKAPTAEINVAKHRNGSLGIIQLGFRHDLVRFDNLKRGASHED
jgi:replicative DNA helicase